MKNKKLFSFVTFTDFRYQQSSFFISHFSFKNYG